MTRHPSFTGLGCSMFVCVPGCGFAYSGWAPAWYTTYVEYNPFLLARECGMTQQHDVYKLAKNHATERYST